MVPINTQKHVQLSEKNKKKNGDITPFTVHQLINSTKPKLFKSQRYFSYSKSLTINVPSYHGRRRVDKTRVVKSWTRGIQRGTPAGLMAGRDVMAEPTNKPINGATICLPAGTSLSLFPSLSLSFHDLPSSPFFSPRPFSLPHRRIFSPFLSSSLCSRSPCSNKHRRHWQQHHFMRSWNEIHARGLSIRGELPQLLFHDNERSHPQLLPSLSLSLFRSLPCSLSLFRLVKRDFRIMPEFPAITRAPWFLRETPPYIFYPV